MHTTVIWNPVSEIPRSETPILLAQCIAGDWRVTTGFYYEKGTVLNVPDNGQFIDVTVEESGFYVVPEIIDFDDRYKMQLTKAATYWAYRPTPEDTYGTLRD